MAGEASGLRGVITVAVLVCGLTAVAAAPAGLPRGKFLRSSLSGAANHPTADAVLEAIGLFRGYDLTNDKWMNPLVNFTSLPYYGPPVHTKWWGDQTFPPGYMMEPSSQVITTYEVFLEDIRDIPTVLEKEKENHDFPSVDGLVIPEHLHANVGVKNSGLDTWFKRMEDDNNATCEGNVTVSVAVRSLLKLSTSPLEDAQEELPLSADFISWCSQLPDDYNHNTYEAAVRSLGTHYASSISLGAAYLLINFDVECVHKDGPATHRAGADSVACGNPLRKVCERPQASCETPEGLTDAITQPNVTQAPPGWLMGATYMPIYALLQGKQRENMKRHLIETGVIVSEGGADDDDGGDGVDEGKRADGNMQWWAWAVAGGLTMLVSAGAGMWVLCAAAVLFRQRGKADVSPEDEYIQFKDRTKDKWSLLGAEVSIGDRIGSGGSAVVHKGWWGSEEVAIKRCFEAMDGSTACKVMNQEVRVLTQVTHPSVVRLWGFCKDQGYLVMEYCENGSLDTMIHTGQVAAPDYWRMVERLVVEVAQGMNHLHVNMHPPILHRDLKPANILLTRGYHAKIADFGLSRPFRHGSLMTQGAGTPAYCAPEVWLEAKKRGDGGMEMPATLQFTERSDVFSFGVMLWEIVTRSIPFAQYRLGYAVTKAISEGERPPISESMLKEFPVYCSLMERCWSQDPATRPSFAEVLEILSAPEPP